MRLFGLIGKPLTHSFSKAFFTEKFKTEQIADCAYRNFELPSIDALPALLQDHPELCGLNVTIPFKKDVIPYLAQANEVVAETGACNCIRIHEGRLHGHNTDVIGFRKSLESVSKPHHTNALVLGTGGSSVAVQYALRKMGITYTLVSREKKQGTVTYDQIDRSMIMQHQLIINTSPVGMFPHSEAAPKIPYEYLGPAHLLFDLIYNPEQTLFLKRGAAAGAATCNGYHMLVLQAEESWKIWNR
jgi:shikimate dehydrogenase